MVLTSHQISLADKPLVLRPMTEADWALLLKWNNDPEVLYYAEGDNVESRSLAEIQSIHRHVSQTAFCFIIEINHQSIGECWLQQMNLTRILQRHPDQDCRRIDLMIGEKHLWGQGYGTRIIHLLTHFAFEQQSADVIFGCDIADYNLGSQRAFQKAGFGRIDRIAQPPTSKAQYRFDYALSRGHFLEQMRPNPSENMS